MTNPVVNTEPTAAVAPDEIDLLIGSLEAGEAEGAEIEEVVEDEFEELEITAAEPDELAALDAALTKDEVYSTATSEVEVASTEKPAKAPKEKKAKAPAAPKIERDLASLSDEAFRISSVSDPAADKATLIAARPKQKKIAEKFDQTIAALNAGRKPSVYVVECFKVLDAKKELTATDLVTALKTAGYTDGTARSQAGQIMALFDTLRIADRTKNALDLRPDSTFADKLRKLV